MIISPITSSKPKLTTSALKWQNKHGNGYRKA